MSISDFNGFCEELNFLRENFVGKRSMHVAGITLFSGYLHEGIFYNKIYCLAFLIKLQVKGKLAI